MNTPKKDERRQSQAPQESGNLGDINPTGHTQGGGSKGDNRSNTDADGNRGGVNQRGKSRPDNIADTGRDRTQSVGKGDAKKNNRDRGDGTKRDGDEGGVS